ncbi:hypothetical protein [Methanobacterium sp.]|jgi:hypothetical protein|uniref:hypothetical protein n=1 Tax=Methanobacterium sp. TaxID=2164 RepID=UPI00315906E2
MHDEKERIDKQVLKHDTLAERMQKTRDEIIKTYRERKKSEKEFLEIIKKQKKYWEDQLRVTDPQKDKERYDELKEKIKNEETLIGQIKDELNSIDKELGKEKEHKEKEHK